MNKVIDSTLSKCLTLACLHVTKISSFIALGAPQYYLVFCLSQLQIKWAGIVKNKN